MLAALKEPKKKKAASPEPTASPEPVPEPEPAAPVDHSAAWATDEKQEEHQAHRQDAFWEVQDQEKCWTVPFGRDLAGMSWLPEGRTGLQEAIERAHTKDKTVLIIDNTGGDGNAALVDRMYLKRKDVTVLDTTRFLRDEREEKRTHKQVMNDARAALVAALREGHIFYMQMGNTVTDFANGNYTDDATLPLCLFDHQAPRLRSNETHPRGPHSHPSSSPPTLRARR